MAKKPPYPFVKWLGGKGRLAAHVLARLPEHCETYYEPMLGGGAVFIEMAKAGRFDKAVLGDTNPELMSAWRVVQSDVEALIKELKKKRYTYDRTVYLKIREEDPSGMDPVLVAARFIYLNRTCFNGLYRVNGDGRFNTPFGQYKDPVICDAENLRALSGILDGITLREADFEKVVEGAGDGDAVYFDPPYIPISDTSNFDKYTAGGFGKGEHERLARVFTSLAKQKTRVVLSNSSADEAVRLYGKFDFDWLTGTRSVGGPADYRKSVKEMIVFAGPKEPAGRKRGGKVRANDTTDKA